ncbi:hypothetical protein B0H14DRAFT_3673445 [Mycena olivaceomarginata]|nr:hypothetical protein B0H14DRAFT_3673445 [Mycena olivaceomarginata]
MPRQSTVTEIRLANITACLTPALTLLNELNDAFGPPFIQPISNTVLSLMSMVQNVNRHECTDLMENIHKVLYVIVELHIKSEIAGSLPPSVVDHIGKFVQTLHKIYTFVEAQQEGNKIKQIFRQSEMNTLLKECHTGLLQAFGIFKARVNSQNSTTSFSILPSKPKIFYGRESELEHVMKMLCKESPRIAILGGGGMGKTSLAKAVLHHPDISEKFEHRFFVSAESATNSVELAALIGFLEEGVEEFLSLLADIPHVALIITMRGAERPGKVPWTHPFLPALQPLSDHAAQQIFVDITDNCYEGEDIAQLLRLTDNMPLAVDLIAHLADYEGFSNVLVRWETEKTAVLSTGYDQKSNLDISIQLSLSSPRITSESKELLSLLSILPDGFSDIELVQSKLPIANILACKATLLATSLAYQDTNKRLRSLMPIRDHIQQFSPPSYFLMQSLRKYFYSVLELYKKYDGEQLRPVINQITLILGNLQEVLQLGLEKSDPNLLDTIYCALSLNSFYRITGRGHTPLMDTILMSFPQPTDHRVEASFLIELISSRIHMAMVDAEIVILQVLSHIQHFNDPALECRFYLAAGGSHFDIEMDPAYSLQFLDKARQLGDICRDKNLQIQVLVMIAQLKWCIGEYCAAILHASKAQRLSKLWGNLYQEAEACRVVAMCTMSVGNWEKSMINLHRAKEILSLCGLSGGLFDYEIKLHQAEIHFSNLKYAEAQRICSEIIETTSPDHNFQAYGYALLNIAEITIMIGQPTGTEEVCQHLSRAKEIFEDMNLLEESNFCDLLWTDMQFKEGKLDFSKVKFLQYTNAARGKNNEIMLFCLERLADVNSWQSVESQSIWPVIYLAYAYKSKEKLALHRALLFLGDVFVFHEDGDITQNLWIVALEGFTYMDAKDVAEIGSRLAAVEESPQEALTYLVALLPPVQTFQQLAICNEARSSVEEVEEERIGGRVKALIPLTL